MPLSLLTLSERLAGRIGESDCEELGSGFLVQPVNALTSLAYVAAGAAILAVGWRRTGRADAATTVFALLLAAIGLGSVAFHGPQPDGSRFLHDAPILLAVVFMLSVDVSLLSARVVRWWPLFTVSAAVAAVVSVVSPDAAVALTGVVIVAVVTSEVIIYRRRLRPTDVVAQRKAYGLTIGVGALAGASWLFGRTDSPACDPDGYLQFHGVWHLLSATVFAVWWWLAIGSTPRTRPATTAEPCGTMVP